MTRIEYDTHEIATVSAETFSAKLDLEILHGAKEQAITLGTVNVNRPGMQLAGFYGHFVAKRVQVIGEMETEYLRGLSQTRRLKAIEEFMAQDIPCLILSTAIEPVPEILRCAKKYKRIILRSKLNTTQLINKLVIYLNDLLAPHVTIHGVLIDIYGVGVLIIGRSSIGKSETALELVQRDHRLIADDAVTIKRVNDILIGSSPPVIRNFLEVRGIGIVDISNMYGAGSVRMDNSVDLIVELEEWDSKKVYDRLGEENRTHCILGVEVSKLLIPVKPGRNLAAILEVAARNFRLKSMGYDTLRELNNRMDKG